MNELLVREASDVSAGVGVVDTQEFRCGGGETFDPQLIIQEQRRELGADEEIVQVVARSLDLVDLLPKLRVDGGELLVERAELLGGRLEFLVRRLELLVHRHRLFVRRPQLLVGRLEFLDGVS